MPDGQPPVDGHRRAEQLALVWREAIVDSSLNSMNRRTLLPRLTAMSHDLLTAVDSDDPDTVVPFAVGAALVGAHFTEVAALQCTLSALGRYFGGDAAGPDPGRVADVLGAVAAGFAQALRDRTRAEQERITASAFAAKVAAEQARWDSDARLAAVFTEAVIGIAVCDVGGPILEVNRSLCQMLGYDRHELTDRTFWEFTHPDDLPGAWDGVREMVSGATGHLRFEKPYFRKDGTQIWTDLVLSLIREQDGSPRYVVAMIENVTSRHQLQIRLQHQAQHDPLTGLPNRALFFDRLDRALADGPGRVGVCYLDLDGFKTVNDTLGHDQGDVLLQTVARRLSGEMDRSGHLVARMGGDEFVVLVQDAGTADQLRDVASRALDIVRRPVRLHRTEVVISASVGVVRSGNGGPGAAALMKAADSTMYWAKQDGRDRVALFDAQRHRDDVGRSALAARMPEALARGEFVVEYQPLVRLSDGRVTGVEALVRWQLPSGERLSPDRFIGLAEETGMIVPRGLAVLTEACRRAAEWRDAIHGCDCS